MSRSTTRTSRRAEGPKVLRLGIVRTDPATGTERLVTETVQREPTDVEVNDGGGTPRAVIQHRTGQGYVLRLYPGMDVRLRGIPFCETVSFDRGALEALPAAGLVGEVLEFPLGTSMFGRIQVEPTTKILFQFVVPPPAGWSRSLRRM